MLPIPFNENIPLLLKKALSVDDSGQALADFWDEKYLALKNEILNMQYFKLPERCPSGFLDTLGDMLAASIQQGDSDFTKRFKILKAIETHKLRSTWTADAKNRIDAITGLSAVIWSQQDNDDAVWLAQESSDLDFYWMTWQDNSGTDDDLGIWWVGDFTEYVIAGNIYINCHEGINVSTLTAAQIAQIVSNLEMDVAPAYMAIYLGYINAVGQFIVYSGGIID